jgi:hypothetical protein
MCTCAITSSGAAATAAASAAADGSQETGLGAVAGDSGSSASQRWETTSLIAKLQAATAHLQLLQSKLGAAEAKLAMHRAAAVAAKQRIDDLEGMLMQLQLQHRSKLLQTLLAGQQPLKAAGVPHTLDCVDGGECCCISALQAASADGCASQDAAAAGAAPSAWQQHQLQQLQHPSWELALSPSHAPAMLHQQQQLQRLQEQLRMAICDNTVLCYECMHLQHLLVQERFVGKSACQVRGGTVGCSGCIVILDAADGLWLEESGKQLSLADQHMVLSKCSGKLVARYWQYHASFGCSMHALQLSI